MTTEITLPIKCSTVNRVKEGTKRVFIWSLFLVAFFVGFALIGVMTMMMLDPSSDLAKNSVIFLVSLPLIGAMFFVAYIICPVEFKCVQG